MAVPFIGKDVLSDAAEFAQPDVLIGFTILAYRYSGLRDEAAANGVHVPMLRYDRRLGFSA